MKLTEILNEIVTEASDISKITQPERKRISNEFHKHPELGGTKKVDSLGKVLTIITQALDVVGFQLDMVTGDLLLGEKGQRLLPYSRKSIDPKTDPIQIQNSRISFTWENMNPDKFGPKNIEIIAYPS
jgi:hypothetical protein